VGSLLSQGEKAEDGNDRHRNLGSEGLFQGVCGNRLPLHQYRRPSLYYKPVNVIVEPAHDAAEFDNNAREQIARQGDDLGIEALRGRLDAALHGGRHPELGHNVVYHEFAHKLDMLDGAADGTSPLRDRSEYRDWVQTCSREYLRLKHDAEHGKKSFLGAYGATSEAEFFAVATEQFFDQPS